LDGAVLRNDERVRTDIFEDAVFNDAGNRFNLLWQAIAYLVKAGIKDQVARLGYNWSMLAGQRRAEVYLRGTELTKSDRNEPSRLRDYLNRDGAPLAKSSDQF
jgi:hypothetical protein